MRRRVRRLWCINDSAFYQLQRLGRRMGMSRERLLNDILADYFADMREGRRARRR